MHSALVIVKKPDFFVPTERPRERSWSELLNSLQAAEQNHPEIAEYLGEGCVFVTMDKGIDALAHVLNAVAKSPFPYRALFFEKPPQWVIGSGR